MTPPTDTAFHRPPRAFPPPVPADDFLLAAPPSVQNNQYEGWVHVLFPVIGSLSMVAFAIVYDNMIFFYIAIGLAVLALVFAVAMRSSQKRMGRRNARRQRRLYREYLVDTERRLADVAERQRIAAERRHPDLEELADLAASRAWLWERRPDDADFLAVRAGRGPVAHVGSPRLDLGNSPLTEYERALVDEAESLAARWCTVEDVPVAVALTAAPVVSVVGPAHRSRAAVRAMLTQLALAHAPCDLRIVVSHHEGDGDWEWCKWLPHARGETGEGRAPRPALAAGSAALAAVLDEQVGPRVDGLRMLAEATSLSAAKRLDAPYLVLVLDGFSPRDQRARLPLLREGLSRPDALNIVVICTVEEAADEPAETCARLRLGARGDATLEETGPAGAVIGHVVVDELGTGAAEAVARTLAPVRLYDQSSASGLDARDGLLSLLGIPSIEALDPAAEWSGRPRALALRALIGVGADGERVELDLKQGAEGGMGPHGLIIGATGSGKSELLRTLVMSLAISHSPEELAFVFVDFKGGAAFADLEALPHTAGMITNLQSDLSLVDRMHDALYGEQERRQRMLRDAGNIDDVIAYRRLRERDPSLAPLPDLLVVIDEFGELLASRPEYIDLFVAIGRVGRSLGIHLLFSSQRFDEGRLRGLESHLRYRICLRTFSAEDSKGVLGTPDAYLLPSEPGLGYLKVDTGLYERFRATLVRRPRSSAGARGGGQPVVAAFGGAGAPQLAGLGAGAPTVGDGAADLRLIAERLHAAPSARPVHQVWCPPLPERIALGPLPAQPAFWERTTAAAGLRATIGMVDVPKQQRTEPLTLNLTGAGGHLAVVGAPQTGKSMLLRTLVLALARGYTPEELQVHAIDLGGGLLRGLGALPHVAAVAGKADRELVLRIAARLAAELEEREEAFRRLGIDSIGDAPFGEILFVIDGWAQLRRDFEDLDLEIEALLANGLAYGIHVAVSANRWAEMRQSVSDNLGSRLELHLTEPLDSEIDRKRAEALPSLPGRGLNQDGLEFQAAVPAGDEVAAIAARWQGPRTSAVRVLPRRLEREELPPYDAAAGVPIGIEEERLETVGIDLCGTDAHLLVLGDGESGRTNVLRAFVEGLAGARSQVTVLDPRRTLADVAALEHVERYAGARAEMDDAVAELAMVLRGRMERGDSAGPEQYLVVDDYDLLAGDDNPLAAILGALPHGRDLGFHLVVARRVAGMIRASFEPVCQSLLELRVPGLLLSGDPSEGAVLEGRRAQSLPPGRGHLITRGDCRLVQTVFAPPRSSGAAPAHHKITTEGPT